MNSNILEGLRNDTTKNLQLEGSGYAYWDIYPIARALMFNSALQELHLRSTGIDDMQVNKLADAIIYNSSLQTFDLAYSHMIGDASEGKLAISLEYNSSLQILSLMCCGMESIGICKLARPLKQNFHLQILDLRYNVIEPIVEDYLVQVLDENPFVVMRISNKKCTDMCTETGKRRRIAQYTRFKQTKSARSSIVRQMI